MATKDVLTSKELLEGPWDDNKIYMVPMDRIILPKLFEMRDQKATDVTELAENIKSHGRVVNPGRLRPSKEKKGYFELVQGHRRYKALELLKWAAMPCTIKAMADEEAFEEALSENIGREDPTPMEEARAYKRARDDFKMSLDAIATKVGKDKSTISNRMRLLTMAPKVVQAMDDGKITPGHCEHGFMRLKNQGDQDKLLKDVLSDIKYRNVTVKDIEAKADGLNKDYEAGVRLQQFLQENKDKIITKNCPCCGCKPNPRESLLSAKEPKFKCTSYHYQSDSWDPFKKYDKKDFKERSFGGSNRTSKFKHENTRPNQVKAMASRYSIIEWYIFLFNKVLKSKPKIDDITLGSNSYYSRGECGLRVAGDVAKGLMDLIGFELTFSELRNDEDEYKHVPKEYVTQICMAANSRADIHTARGSVLTLEADMGVFMKDKRDEAIVLRETTFQNELWREDVHFKKGSCIPGEVLGLKCEGVKIEAIFEDLTMLVKDTKTGKEHFIQDDDVKLMATRIARKHEKDAKGTAGKKAVPKDKDAKPGTCVVCGCTENNPCVDDDEETCAWANKMKTLCTFCAEKMDPDLKKVKNKAKKK